MSSITYARFWKDTGYTEGCLNVPKEQLPSSSPDIAFENLNPTKARMFSELRVPEDYVTMLEYSYLAITVSNNNGDAKVYYGWIDSVEMISDSTNAPITQVNWHVDLWRTYFAQAEFTSGIVRRKPYTTGMNMPPQRPPYRYQTPTTPVSLYQNDGRYWVIVALTKKVTSGDDTVTTLEYRLVPVSASSYNDGLYVTSNARAMPLAKIFNGNWDEDWGIDPNDVISVFLSPMCPMPFTGSGQTASDYITIPSGYWTAVGDDRVAYFVNTTIEYPFTSRVTYFGSGYYKTDDVTEYVINGFDGETVGSLPWGVAVDAVDVRLVYATTSAYIQLRFRPSGMTTFDFTLSHQYGLTFNIPCWALDVTSNTWSSYVYSGQRQYDMDQRALASESSAISGGLSVATSALSGAASGALMGSVVPGIGTLLGGIIGGVGGGLTGALTTGGEFAYETMYKNDALQRMEDTLHAKQADNILLPGNGIDCIFHGRQLTLVGLVMDEYSRTLYNNDLSIYGAKVSEPTADCSTLIAVGGSLQIDDLIVLGDIPPSAKQYIKQRFAQGVIIR